MILSRICICAADKLAQLASSKHRLSDSLLPFTDTLHFSPLLCGCLSSTLLSTYHRVRCMKL